jgi:phosphate-selective porin OprO/OprP
VSLLVFLIALSRSGFAEEAKGLNVYWDDGLHIKTKDNTFEMKIGGRFQLDGAIIDPDDRTKEAFPDLSGNKGEIRRARIYTSGTVYRNYDFKFQVDFAEWPDILYKDAYIDMKNIPYVGTIRVGHQFEPFSLEEETSTKYITFMERALPTLAFDPRRNTGLLLFNTPLNRRLWWGVGAFKPVEDDRPFDLSGNSDWNLSGRIAGLPWFEDKTKLLHLGLSYVHKFRSAGTEEDKRLNFSATPEAHLADELVNTGKLISDGADIINPELALALGPFSLQGEYFDARVDRDTGDNLNFSGFYVYASYFITGESRPYVASEASFGRVEPKRNFDLKSGSGLGAWEVALRYSCIDLNDEDIQGGEEKNFTAGLNWYLNPNVRFMFNYIFAHVEDSDAGTQFLREGDTNIFQMRFQIEF